MNHVVIVGNLANATTLGGYSGSPSLQVNAVQGITSEVKTANPDASVTFDASGTSTTATTAASCSAATQAAIKTADLVIVFAGTDETTASGGKVPSGLGRHRHAHLCRRDQLKQPASNQKHKTRPM